MTQNDELQVLIRVFYTAGPHDPPEIRATEPGNGPEATTASFETTLIVLKQIAAIARRYDVDVEDLPGFLDNQRVVNAAQTARYTAEMDGEKQRADKLSRELDSSK